MRKVSHFGVLALTLTLAGASIFGQTWESESPEYPAYNTVLRRFKVAKREIDAGKVTAARRIVLLTDLRATRVRATALRANQVSMPNGNQALIARYNFLIDALSREITDLEVANSPTTLRLFKGKTVYSRGEEFSLLYKIQENLRGKVWLGMMRADEPRGDIIYTNTPVDLSRYTPKLPDAQAEGIIKYTAPTTDGNYEIRLFEKDRGRLVAQIGFRVQMSFVDELRDWRREIGSAFIRLELKYGFNKIGETFVRAFEAAGADDFKGHSRNWSPSFWATNMSKNGNNAASVFYLNPLDRIDESLRNIVTFRKSYTNAEVEHYRNGMSRWRATYFQIPQFFDRLIAIEAEKNRDLKETGVRIQNLRGDAREEAERAAARRSDDRTARRKAIVEEISRFIKDPIFSFAAGATNPR